jgi:PEP-CTERM motif-containing protein
MVFDFAAGTGETKRKSEGDLKLRNLAVTVGFGLILSSSAWADISGSPLIDYGNVDTCPGCVFPIIQFTAHNAGQTVLSFSLFDENAPNANLLTPLLFEQSTPGTFTIIGIGQQESGFTHGQNLNIPFVLTSGTDVVQNANTFFGYVDGNVKGATNAGTVSTTFPGNGGPVQYFHANYPLAVGGPPVTFDSFVGVGQVSRTYALDVTTTPEPGFYGFLTLGLGALGYAIRRRSA